MIKHKLYLKKILVELGLIGGFYTSIEYAHLYLLLKLQFFRFSLQSVLVLCLTKE